MRSDLRSSNPTQIGSKISPPSLPPLCPPCRSLARASPPSQFRNRSTSSCPCCFLHPVRNHGHGFLRFWVCLCPPGLPSRSAPGGRCSSEEVSVSPPSASEATDTAPGVPSAFESDGEGSFQEQVSMEAEPSSPEMAPPGFEDFKSSWVPLPTPTQPAETTHSLLDAAATTAVAMPEEVAGSLPVLEAMNAETDTAPGLPLPSSKSGEQQPLQQVLPRPPSLPMEFEPSSPEMAPPGFEDFKSSWVPLPTPTQPTETTHSLLDAAATTAVAMLEEVAGSLPVLEAMNADTDTAPGLPLPSSTCGEQQPLQQVLLRPPSPITQAEPWSPDMPPPGFEPPTHAPLAETAHASSDLVATKPVPVTLEKAVWPVQELEAMDVKTDNAHSLLPPSKSRVEGLLEQPLTQMVQSAPCSPDMAPPGFENFKSSWPSLSTPLSRRIETAYILHDAVTEPGLEAMGVNMDARHPLLVPLGSGVEGSSQEPQPRASSPTTQDVPCLPDMAPPGFENFKSSQVLVPSSPLAQTAHTLHNPATTEAVHVSEEAAQPSPALEAMDLNMDTTPSVQPSSESGLEGSMPEQLPRLPSPKGKGTACSPDIVPSGHENLESLQLLQLPALLPQLQTPDALADLVATEAVIVALEEVNHPPRILGVKEEGTAPELEPHTGSLTAHAVDTLLDASATNSVAVKSEETAQSPPTSQTTNTIMDSAITLLLLSENGTEGSLPRLDHQPCSPTAQAACSSPDSLQVLPPPPPPFLTKEMGQMVCGSCRDLFAYPRGAVHVHCASCQTINLVLEAHEVGNVHCGRCETLLMYPSGAPAVKCSRCLFVTEIGERNVRPRISVEQDVSPHS